VDEYNTQGIETACKYECPHDWSAFILQKNSGGVPKKLYKCLRYFIAPLPDSFAKPLNLLNPESNSAPCKEGRHADLNSVTTD
jgi:hypothetical protein